MGYYGMTIIRNSYAMAYAAGAATAAQRASGSRDYMAQEHNCMTHVVVCCGVLYYVVR